MYVPSDVNGYEVRRSVAKRRKGLSELWRRVSFWKMWSKWEKKKQDQARRKPKNQGGEIGRLESWRSEVVVEQGGVPCVTEQKRWPVSG